MTHKLDLAAAVYDGRTLLGFVVEVKPSGWASYDAEQRFLGEYSNRSAAMVRCTSRRVKDDDKPSTGGYRWKTEEI
jgi:hypothetical protein